VCSSDLLVATAATEEELARKIVDVRARISFYASTPQYRAAFAHHGLGDLADELKLLSRSQPWEEMPRYITDDILHTFVTVGTYDQIAGRLLDRYSGVVTHCEFSIPVNDGDDKDRLRDLAKTIQGESFDRARKAIAG
jgi:alkanesulfonate monooxygenase SsuD/methylene tetrahydromethanopterin reductase-like flavin-dependent oxidoreductase (luciferase family)